MIKDNNFLEDEFFLSKLLISIAEKDTRLFDELEKENIINPKQDGNTIVISSNVVLSVEELLKIAESITR